MARRLIGRAVLVSLVCAAAVASADENDLTLERIIGAPAAPGMFNDPSDVLRQSQYKSLMSELGTVMSPRVLTPADTLGYSGFQISFDSSFTQISRDAEFWQKGVEKVSSGYLSTISVFARKGIWLPLPSFELGAGATKLIDSSIYALQFYAKFALHEGFHDWPVPSFALRAAVSRVLGTPQADLTIASVDALVSKSFGLRGTVKLDPYLGATALFTIARSQVIDTTPNIDAYRQGPTSLDVNANTTFPDPDTIVRWRLFTGFRLVYSILAFTGEVAYVLCNDSGSSCGQQDPNAVTDLSGGQLQLSLSGSLIF